ncbi:MAG: transglutaminase-like domain-containing protein [Nannocystaceae bacterium]|nr:transglutaminase family protein [bacterium]
MAQNNRDETRWLARTPTADYDNPAIEELVEARKWRSLTKYERIGATYDFVKDEIAFGYNSSDDLPASAVLADGYGQCNTKGNLLVALLRSVGAPARFHGFTIDKSLQKGAIPSWLYPLAPSRILHSWVEVSWEGEWVPLEGFILDGDYLRALQKRFPDAKAFCGYGAATTDLQNPPVEWRGRPTFIQKDGIAEDLGVFDDPDGLYEAKGTNLSGVRRFLYVNVFRHAMNATVARTRRSWSQSPGPRCEAVQQSN